MGLKRIISTWLGTWLGRVITLILDKIGMEGVVSRILRVSGSSSHEPSSENLQNKQGTSVGVQVGCLMLKLGREIESVKMSVLQAYIFTYLSLSITPLFMKKDDDPLFMESG